MTATNDNDQLQRFLFENIGVRGEIVKLNSAWQTALANHTYPTVVAEQLGQALAASLLLSATLKFEGALILQIQGDGPISLLTVQATDQQIVKGLAHWSGDIPAGDLASLYGEGRLVITIKPAKKKPYQGIVSLQGSSLAESIESYFRQSEQLKTRLWFAVNEDQAVGLLLQELPAHQGKQVDWQRLELLADTISDSELLNLPTEVIIHRLFHQETVRLYDPQAVAFRCDCSKEKVESSLLIVGQEELLSLLQEKGAVDIDCDFCNRHYHFNAADIDQLFNLGQNGESPVRH
ncbi:MAG: molecular chaperone Hsp33 [Cycloclasticus sp.]|jgi:molecular chaperone Hsp33